MTTWRRVGMRMRVASVGLAIGCSSNPSAAPPPDAAPEPDAGPPATGWYGLQDVSVLLPLPSGYHDRNVLLLSSAGNGGPLLDTERFGLLAHDFGLYGDWRVVAARIDPCFPDLSMLVSKPEMCRRQLRLIAQPLTMLSTATPFQFADTSLHLLYDLSQAQFDEMSARWLGLATVTDDRRSTPLGVHAQIALEGLGGTFATRLRAIILAYAGTATLSQVSFFTVARAGAGSEWDFEGTRISAAADTAISIPVVDETTQTVTNTTAQLFDNATLPLVPLVPAATVDGKTVLAADAATVTLALQASLDIDNPSKPFNIDTIDCASCHLANRLRTRAAGLGSPSTGLEAFTAAPYNLANLVDPSLDASPTAMRAFGYESLDPIWSQRTINESAGVAAYFNAKLAESRGQ